MSSAVEKSASLPNNLSTTAASLPLPLSLLSLLPVLSPPQINGCPIHRALCDGWDDKVPAHPRRRCLCFLLPTTKTVISTEAAHGLIVSSAVEKSASQPKQPLSHCRVFALVFVIGFSDQSEPNRPNGFRSSAEGTIPDERLKTLGEASCFCRRIYFFAFSAQKSHVKPQRPLKPTASSTYRWHVYPLQSRIIKLASKTTRHVLSHLKSIVCD